ncbi:MAG: Hpt domain-containing protein, partial [Heliobacteriaceae bacterium]|nr:Hpt domain-containing protein [Heliobacteriaceae bacterium]
MNFMDQYLDLFYAEAREQLETLSRNLLAVETTGVTEDVIHEMFRAAHSLKGASAMAGFNVVAALTHKVEDLLGVVRTGRQELSSLGIDAIFDALDYIQASLFSGESDPGRESYITGRLEEVLPGEVAAESSAQVKPIEPLGHGGEWGDTLAITITFE